ncbi:hypothetical protein F5887DRAFT_864486, partial [Amanita rubescens]
DCVFLSLNPNRVHHPHVETLTKIQTWIDEFMEGAGMTKEYTTHSFHQGGWGPVPPVYAYSIGQAWLLSIIRWWGGWAEGENI